MSEETLQVGNFLMTFDENSKVKNFELNPNAYPNAIWAGTTAITDDGRIGLTLKLESGEKCRFSLSKKDANSIARTINDSFYRNSLSQSERSSEMSSNDESTPERLDQV